MIDPPVTEVKFDGPDKAIVDLLPTADHPAFDGHFPHNPILPGVVQIDWALRLAVLHLGSKDGTRDYQVKFQRPIVPNAPVSVELRSHPPGACA